MKAHRLEKAVFLDFDGVLFDTVKEAYCLCLFATKRVKSIKEIDFNSRHFRDFKKNRFRINCAADYCHLLERIGKNEGNGPASPTDRDIFEKGFLTTRSHLKRNNFDYWLSLHRPYGFLLSLAGVIKANKKNFFIISTKDKDSILKLLEINGFSFIQDNILDRVFYKKFNTKGNIVKFLTSKYFIKESILIDDSHDHLSSCGDIKGLEILQAGWGYCLRGDNTYKQGDALIKIKKLLGAQNV